MICSAYWNGHLSWGHSSSNRIPMFLYALSENTQFPVRLHRSLERSGQIVSHINAGRERGQMQGKVIRNASSGKCLLVNVDSVRKDSWRLPPGSTKCHGKEVKGSQRYNTRPSLDSSVERRAAWLQNVLLFRLSNLGSENKFPRSTEYGICGLFSCIGFAYRLAFTNVFSKIYCSTAACSVKLRNKNAGRKPASD